MFDGALFFSGHDLYVTTNASIYLYTVELQDDEIVDVSELYCSAAVEDIIYRYNAVGVDLTEEEAENILDCTDETPHVDDGGELDWYVQDIKVGQLPKQILTLKHKNPCSVHITRPPHVFTKQFRTILDFFLKLGFLSSIRPLHRLKKQSTIKSTKTNLIIIRMRS